MKAILLMGVFVSMVSIVAAQNLQIFPEVPEEIAVMIRQGQYDQAKLALQERAEQEGEPLASHLGFCADVLDRIRFDFRKTEEDVLAEIREFMPDVTPQHLVQWREMNHLWFRFVDGQNWYFNRGVRNLLRLNAEVRKLRTISGKPTEFYVNHIADVIKAASTSSTPYVLPTRLRISYQLTLKPGAVPPGEIVRCWLAYPIECNTQKDIKLIESFPEVKHTAAPNYPQRTLYFEQPASASDEATVFKVVYEYTSLAQYQTVDPAKVVPYDVNSELFKTYTASRDPHLVFTPEIVASAKEAVGDETNPYLMAKNIYDWVVTNITYTSMLEYSTVPNLSAWSMKYRQGDCGVFGLLFIVMCRSVGVPARWQSGWSPEPGETDMHDWAEFYVEPYGWLHADPSRGVIDSPDPLIRDFHFGNFDCYRLVCNSDYGRPLDPPKRFPRSETVDFQRGEVEYSGNNLYYDKWSYSFEATVVK